LGALIGLYGAKLHYGRERQKEKSNRQIAAIQKIGEDFMAAHSAAIDFSVEVRTAIGRLQRHPSPTEPGKLIRSQVLSAESRLAVLGLEQCQQALWNYYDNLQSLFEKLGGTNDQEIEEATRALQDTEKTFFEQLREAYKRAEAD
jgi:hypothetical protein